MHLMLVEYDQIFLQTLCERLRNEGHHPEAFDGTRKAYKALEHSPGDYDAILLDQGLPEISGLEWLRNIRTKGHQHPVVLISGNASVKVTQELVNLELTAMLLKPFSIKELQKILLRLEQEVDQLKNGHVTQIEQKKVATSEDWKQEMVQLLQLAIDVWLFEGNDLNSLAVDSGFWTLTREQDHYRAKTLKNYLKLKTLPKNPKWQLVIRTAQFVINHCDKTSLSIELEFRIKLFEKSILHLHNVGDVSEESNSRSFERKQD